MSELVGHAGALIAGLMWGISSTLFTLGGRRQSHQAVNSIRLLGATILLGICHIFIIGTLIPDASLYVWLMLGLSGVMGLAMGDGLLMWAHIKIGPRLSMLIMSLVPIVTTTLAWFLFDERIEPIKLMAIVVTIGSVAWVIMEKADPRAIFKVTKFGVILAIGGMLGQALQLIIAKDAIEHLDSSMPSLTATYIRIMWGTAAIWAVAIPGRNLGRILNAFKDRRFMGFTALGTIAGPFIGIWASYLAIEFAPVGIASTLMALTPLFMIPISFVVFKEKPSWRALIGTMIALAGVAVIFIF